MSEKKAIITGATGMVGGIALRICLDSPGVSEVTVVGRRSLGLTNAKLKEIILDDFLDYSRVADDLENQDVALFCLGAYTGAVPDDQFRQITVDYTLSFAQALYKASPHATFCLLSGQGADQTGQSRMAFARYKGIAERELGEVGFPQVKIFRPGYIYPVTPRDEPNLMYQMLRPLFPLIQRVYPNVGVSSQDLAKAMVQMGMEPHGNDKTVLENKDIRFLE